MVVSWLIARRRIAAGVRPGWFAAWGLVLLDAVLMLPVLGALAFSVSYHFFSINPLHWAIWWSLIITVFLPMQVILIASSLWAAKSRWDDTPGKGEDA